MPSLAAKKARTCEMKYLSLSYKQNQTIQWARRTELAIIIGWGIFCKYHLSSIELYFAFLAEFFGWSLATLFLEKHDIKVSTTFSSSAKKLKLRQFWQYPMLWHRITRYDITSISQIKWMLLADFSQSGAEIHIQWLISLTKKVNKNGSL